MITATQVPIPEVRNNAIKAWLRKVECSQLVEIVESKQKTCEAAMTNLATESARYPMKVVEANEKIMQAARYVTFLEVLQELKDEEFFTNTTLK